MNKAACIVALIIAVLVFASLNEKRTPVLVEEIPPEQSHYVVFYRICGALQHILVTTDPPLRHSMATVPSQELLGLLKATPKEQVIVLSYMGPECYYTKPFRAPAEPIDV